MPSQASQPEFDIMTMAVWIVVLIAAAILLAVVIVTVKRWTFRDEQPAETSWTLHDLVTLRDSGELTIPQYERLRADLIRRVKDTGTAEENARDGVPDRPGNSSEGDSVA